MNAPWPSLIVDQEQFEDASVHELFHKCYDAHKHLSDLPKAADEAQAVLRKLLAMLQRCDTMIDTTGLFSDNEDQEDISTGSLRYLLVEFLTAEVLSQTREKDSRARLMSIALACRHHQSFLKRLQKFDLVPKSVGVIMDRLEHGETASPLSVLARDMEALKRGLQVLRNEKIEQKRQERTIEQQIEQIRALNGCDEEDLSTSGYDEEMERELWASLLHHSSVRSLQAIGVLTQEREMLAVMLRRADDDVDAAQREAEEVEREEVEKARALMRDKLFAIAGDMSAGSKRQQLAKDVFNPSYILPTMTVEQAGMIELREAQQRQEREAEIAALMAKEKASKTEDQLDEEELTKLRDWDDFKDEHPTGYGNSKLRPCAL